MTKTKSTKRALLMSGLALLMCVSMLIGSTFAWFTDSVTSGNNKIVAGTLQVDLELLEEDGSWTSIKESGKAIFDYKNWEPGYTDVKILRVSNKGTLALKWLAKFVSNYELSALADVIDVYVNTEVDAYPTNRSDLSGWTNVGTVKEFVNTISATTKGTLEAGASANLGIALKMQETAGNQYQGMDLGGTFDIQIIATQYTSENDSFDNQYDLNAAIYVDSADDAQAALDNAKKGDVIVLASGVNYGTLYLRPVDGNANTTTSLNEADGEGLTVYRNEYIRTVEDLTILGTTNAKVDAIKVESGYIANGSSSCNLVNVKGLVIDSVEFTDKADCTPHTYSAPIFFNLTWTDVDGLTVKNCKLIGNNDKVNFVYFTIDSSSAFDGEASNVTLTGNTVDGIARLCELRQTKNVTITDNVIKNTVLHGMLLTVHNGSYTGDVTITGNTAYGINDRFVRMAGAGDANVVIKDNTIIAYLGEDADYIKVTDSNGTPVIEDNTLVSVGAKDYDSLKAAIVRGEKNIVLVNDITVDKWIMFSETKTIGNGNIITVEMNGLTIDGNGHTLTVNSIESARNGDLLFDGASNLNISNLTIKYADGLAGGINLKSGVISNVTFIGGGNIIYPGTGEIKVENCTFIENGAAFYNEHETDNLTVTGCTFNLPDDRNVILIRGDVEFTNNIVNSGRTVNIVSGSPVVTGNNFNNVRLKVYSAATANISGNIINNLAFEDNAATYSSSFADNTMSAEAQAALAAMTKAN